MNKSYRSIWNEALGAWVAASENANARGRRSGRSVRRAAVVALAALGLQGVAAADTSFGTGYSVNPLGAICTAVGTPASPSNAWTCQVPNGNGGFASISGVATAAGGGPDLVALATWVGTNLGSATTSTGLVMGNTASQAMGANTIAIGNGAKVRPDPVGIVEKPALEPINGIAIGTNATVGNENGIALGNNAGANKRQSIAIGDGAKVLWDGKAQADPFTGQMAIGSGATVGAGGGTGAMAIGRGASADNGNIQTAVGAGAAVRGNITTALGSQAVAVGDTAAAVGVRSHASGYDSIAFGTDAIAGRGITGNNVNAASAIGVRSAAQGGGSTAVGTGAYAFGNGSGAISAWNPTAPRISSAAMDDTSFSIVGGTNNFAVGNRNLIGATSSNNVAMGNDIKVGASGASFVEQTKIDAGVAMRYYVPTFADQKAITNSVAIGQSASVTANEAVAVGNKAKAQAVNAIAIGNNANAVGASAYALGENATALGQNAVALGADSTAQTQFAMAMGRSASAKGQGALAIGGSAATAPVTADGTGAIAIGGGGSVANPGARATAAYAIALGNGAQANGGSSISIGKGNVVNGQNSGAIGDPSVIDGANSYSVGNTNTLGAAATNTFVLGNNVNINVANATALGNATSVTKAGGVALGSGSAATTDLGVAGYNPTGATLTGATWNSTLAAVSVGSAGNTRQITNVAAGKEQTDAVNVAQLTALAGAVVANEVHYFSVKSTGGGNYDNKGAAGLNAIAVGMDAEARQNGDVAMGVGAKTATSGTGGNVVIGQRATITGAGGYQSVAIGHDAKAGTVHAVAVGTDAQANLQSTALGYNAQALGSGGSTVAVGSGARATGGTNAAAIGVQANASGSGAVAIGKSANASHAGSVALGTESVTAAVVNTPGATINGKAYTFAGTDALSTVSVGSGAAVNGVRTLTNVAAGRLSETSTDTVNGSQLYATNLAISTVTSGGGIKYFHANSTDPDSLASGPNSVAIGPNSVAAGSTSLAAGNSAVATSSHALAIGNHATANAFGGVGSVAIGGGDETRADRANIAGKGSAAVGFGSQANATGGGDNQGGSAFGTYAQANNGSYNTALGYRAVANAPAMQADGYAGALASGAYANASASFSTALGSTAQSTVFGGVALGAGSIASTPFGAIGYVPPGADDGQRDVIAGTKALTLGAVSVGYGTQYRQITHVAAGTALSDAVNVAQLQAVQSQVTIAGNKWVVGSQADATYVAPVATGTASTAVGSGAAVNANNSVAVGTGAVASVDNSVALGNGSTTAAATPTAGATIRGTTYNFAGATPAGVVSVGGAGAERQVQNVAAGQLSATSTDAVNGSQLYATNQAIESISSVAGAGINVTTAATGTGIAIGTSVANVGPGGTATYTAGNNMVLTQNGANTTFAVSDNPNFNSVTVGNTSITNNGVSIVGGPSMTTSGIDAGGQPITNVAPGVNGTDAVNMNQFNAGIGAANQNVNQLRNEVAVNRREANAGTAGAMAMAGMPQAHLPGKSMLAAGVAAYEGQTAVAIGVSKLSDNGKWVMKFTGSANSRGNVGVSAGAGFHW